jgi:hypothetical protein
MALDVLGRTALAVGSMASLFVLLHLWMDPSSLTLGATSPGQCSVNTAWPHLTPPPPPEAMLEDGEGFFACNDLGVCALIPFSFHVQRHIDQAFSDQVRSFPL